MQCISRRWAMIQREESVGAQLNYNAQLIYNARLNYVSMAALHGHLHQGTDVLDERMGGEMLAVVSGL